MAMSSPIFRLRRGPPRKSSTPWFPGAWPNSSVLNYEEDANTQNAQVLTKEDGPPQLPHLEQVMDFHQHISESFAGGPFAPILTPPSVSMSQNSQMSNMTDTSTTASSTLQTPDVNSSPHFHTSTGKNPTFRRLSSFISQTTARKNINPGRPNNDSDSARAHRFPSNSIPDLPPLSLPTHDLSMNFSPADYLSTTDDGYYSPSPQSSTIFLSPTFHTNSARTSTSPFIQYPIDIATSFFPVPSSNESNNQQTPFSSASNIFDHDSPVLPSDRNSRISGFIVQPFAPNARPDLDAFGMAASLAGGDSFESLPTSLNSGSDSVSNMSRHGTARERAYRQSSQSSDASMSLSTEHRAMGEIPSALRHADGAFSNEDRAGVEHTETRGDYMYPPGFRAVSSRVDTEPRRRQVSNDEKLGKILRLEKVKKFGGRIRKLLLGKNWKDERESLGIKTTTTTAITAVEYTSEHPISLSESRSRSQVRLAIPNPKPKSPHFKGKHRVSLPAPASPSPPLPRVTRPVSFLAMEPGASRPRIPSQFLRVPRSPAPVIQRVRTQTAPQVRSSTVATQAGVEDQDGAKKARRRFSLTSALSRSGLDALRTTVAPHPPLPAVIDPRALERPTVKEKLRPQSAIVGKQRESALAMYAVRPDQGLPNSRYRNWTSGACENQPAAARNAMDYSSPSSQLSRQRTQTQPAVRTIVVNDKSPAPREGRARRFSISSVISKRATRARSMISGWGTENCDGPTRDDIGKPSGPEFTGTATMDGVQFDMLTPPASGMRTPRSGGDGRFVIGSETELDHMSFALTPEQPSVNSTALSLYYSGRSTPAVEASDVAEKQVGLHASGSTGGTVGTESAVSDDDERKEDRGFLRALGLEFDAIARRAGQQ